MTRVFYNSPFHLSCLALFLSTRWVLIPRLRWMDSPSLSWTQTLRHQEYPEDAWCIAVPFSHSSGSWCRSHRICPAGCRRRFEREGARTLFNKLWWWYKHEARLPLQKTSTGPRLVICSWGDSRWIWTAASCPWNRKWTPQTLSRHPLDSSGVIHRHVFDSQSKTTSAC